MSNKFRIVETDNFGGDYPDEKFLPLPEMTLEHAVSVADAINRGFVDPYRLRYWVVRPSNYILKPAFEP